MRLDSRGRPAKTLNAALGNSLKPWEVMRDFKQGTLNTAVGPFMKFILRPRASRDDHQ